MPKAGSAAKSLRQGFWLAYNFLTARACKVAIPYIGLFCELFILVTVILSTIFKKGDVHAKNIFT